ncbi:MAG: DUF2284 domain-containing protein [Promethearchaeota archaeon]
MKREVFEEIFKKYGIEDFKWISSKNIKLSYWVRMKCMYGCPNYGKKPSCPPNSLTFSECENFFNEYEEIVIFHFAKKFDKPEERHEWSRKLHLKLLKVEREVFLSGYVKAFLICLDSCKLCSECLKDREHCKNIKQVRPTPEALSVDVFSTVKSIGYPINVLKDYTDEMNRYAFLLVE